MICGWKELLSILPIWIRRELELQDPQQLQEIRIRIHAPPELVTGRGSRWLSRKAAGEDLHYTVNTASRYSPWAAQTMALGYLSAPGGHRVGLCGEACVHDGKVTGLGEITSVCIRVAGDHPGIASGIPTEGSVLILGAPGWGKTTLLRDLARSISEGAPVAVADERGELFPSGMTRGRRMDVLSLCPKRQAIDRLIRTMSPRWIAVDEITEAGDCHALIRAAGCGVQLLATAHAGSREDLYRRPVYRPLIQNNIFRTLVILNEHKQAHYERMNL